MSLVHLVGSRVIHLGLKLDLVLGDDGGVWFDTEKLMSIHLIHVDTLMHHICVKIRLCRQMLTKRSHRPVERWWFIIIIVQVRRLWKEDRLILWSFWDPSCFRISSLVKSACSSMIISMRERNYLLKLIVLVVNSRKAIFFHLRLSFISKHRLFTISK